MSKVRLAFLGVGDVAQRDYLPEFHRIADRAEIVAVCGRGETRARAVAAQYNVPRVYTEYQKMLQDGDIDAVVNLTPIQLHFETTLAALQAGKHVYSEKPMASALADAERLRKEAEKHSRVFVCAPCEMLFPQIRYAQALLDEKAIGEVYSARGYGHGGVPPWYGFPSDPSQYFIRGGGPQRDIGIYALHALTGLLGPVKRVTAFAARTRDSFVVPDGPVQGKVVPMQENDNWHILLDFGNARLAYVAANNCVQDTRSPEMEVFGVDGTLALSLLNVTAPIEVLRAGKGWEQVKLPQTGRAKGPDHILGVEELVHCIQSGAEPVLNADHAVHVIEVIERAAQSAAEGRAMDVSSAFTRAPKSA